MVATGEGGHNANGVPPTLGDALEQVADTLDTAPVSFGHGTDNAWDEAVQLVLAGAGLPADSGAECLEASLTADQWQRMQLLLERRVVEGLPLPYLTGRAWFAGREFRCDARALVPRSPLAELILADYAPWWSGPMPRRILDLCCGGGCIGIAAALQDPEAQVVMADIDADALALAAENIELHGVGARVSCLRSDGFEALHNGVFDLILCNPPYVDAADIAAMPREYHSEPLHGLASGEDGLDLPLRLLAKAADFLSSHGLLFLELGNSWEALDALCADLPLTWLEFADGGHGVLLASQEELSAWRPRLQGLAARRAPSRV